jgi:conjugal transfer pilus assembly protein TraL
MEPVSIPSYIDDPPHFLLWSADEMAPILLGLVIGIFTGNA